MAPTLQKKIFYRSVAALVIPMALQNLINVGVQSADVIMLGRVDEKVLSAASLAGYVQFVMTLLFFGFASGASVLTAQYWGKGDTRTIEKVMSITLRLSVGVSLLFAAAALFMPYQVMGVFIKDDEVIRQGVIYLRMVAPGYLFMAFSNTYLNVMRSVEKVLISTVVYFISLMFNIVFNWIFIFGKLGLPAMGIKGAGLATMLARLLELLIVVVYASRNKLIRLRRKDFFSSHKQLFKDYMHYSTPTVMNELLWGLGIAANAVVIGHLGATAVAANSVAQVVRQLATVISFGLANAAAVMIGKAIGAGERDTALQYASQMVKLTLATGALGGVLIFFIRPFVAGGMELSAEADHYLRFLLLLMSVYVVIQAFNTTQIVGIFRGGGDTRFGLYVDAGVMWGGSLLWGALGAFVFHWPAEVVFIVLMSDEVLKLPFNILRYKSQRWLRNVTR